MHRVLIIVVTFQAEKWLDTCLAACTDLKQMADVAVVDNNSSDKTVKIINKDFAGVVDYFYPLTENFGFGYAHNVVFSDSSLPEYDFYFLLNQDASIDPNNFKLLVQAGAAQTEFGILSPIHFWKEGEMDGKFKSYLQFAEQEREGEGIITLPFVNAAIWLLRTDAVKKVGHFHFAFPHYGEDKNYVHRLTAAGFKVGVVLKATGFHLRPQPEQESDSYFAPYELWVFAQTLLLNPSKSLRKAITGTFHQYAKAMWRSIISGQVGQFTDHARYLLKIFALLIGIRGLRSVYVYDKRLK